MPRTDAVTAVMGELLEPGWSRISGRRTGRQREMTRAARRHFPAIFKVIKAGGCHTRGNLRGQLEYLTTKSTHIIDSRGTFDGQRRLDERQIGQVVSRFADRWNERFNPKMGHTTHLLMAFPIGTRGANVRAIAEEVCERFFEEGPSRFDYIAAVHEDRDHPHVHVVVNRRSRDGEMLYFGRDHRFNYDAFREAMVVAAERHGVRLEATRRLERGVVSYKAPIDEIHRAKKEGRAPVERQRVGKALDMALVEIARCSRTYRSLSAIASAENREDVAEALFSAGEILAKGGHLEPDGEVYMAKEESFDSLVSEFSDRVEQLERVIEDRAPQDRAQLERQLNDVLQSVSHLNPLGERSHTLDRAASETGVYSQANLERENLGQLADQETRARIDTALRGTGISTAQLVSRVQVGASNAALEREWLADDLDKIASNQGLNLSRTEEREAAIEKLDDLHANVGIVLADAGVLRSDGLLKEGTPEYEAAMERLAAERGEALREGEGIARAEQTIVQGTVVGTVLERLRLEPMGQGLRDEGETQAFRAQIEDGLSDDDVARLRAGDDRVLEQMAETRIGRLQLAKAYLESDPATAQSEARERVVVELSDEQVEAHRLRHAQTHGDKGTTHG